MIIAVHLDCANAVVVVNQTMNTHCPAQGYRVTSLNQSQCLITEW